MLRKIPLVLVLLALAAPAFAQDKKLSTADFAGTWNIEAMSHQIALVIEPTDATHVTATMMMMGRDLVLKGELVDRSIALVGVKDPAAPTGSAAAEGHVATPAAPPANAKPIVITLLEDGTLSGEMMTNMGAAKWTGEKLKAKKKI
jgi:polyisoprenoid-binding protein YceI